MSPAAQDPLDDAWHVEPGGPALTRTDGPLRLTKLSVSEMDNDVYVVADAGSGQALLVDVADDPDRLRRAVADVDLLAAVQTHGHWDHVRAWEPLADDGWEIWGHRADAELFPRPCDRWLADGEVIEVGALSVEVLHVPGHTPGSLLYLVHGEQRPHLLSGDSLFPGGVGNTFGDDEAFRRLLDGITERVFERLGDETVVHPGHGDATTLGAERPKLPEWRERGW